MTQQVNAIYDHGVFKPLGPLDLNDQELVLLSVQKVNPEVGEVNNLEPTLFEVLDEVGLIGCVKDAPADLSSNPRRMR